MKKVNSLQSAIELHREVIWNIEVNYPVSITLKRQACVFIIKTVCEQKTYADFEACDIQNIKICRKKVKLKS